jgi:hypothetical protein
VQEGDEPRAAKALKGFGGRKAKPGRITFKSAVA